MKNENYINIQGWMINELKLKGNELILYALIYGFSQDGESEYYGSQRYISKALGLTQRSVIILLQKLINKKLIEKVRESHYVCKISLGGEKSISRVKKVYLGGEESISLGGEESISNNNNTINKNNNTRENDLIFKQVINIFKEKGIEIPNTIFSNKTERKSAIELFRLKGQNKIENMLDYCINNKVLYNFSSPNKLLNNYEAIKIRKNVLEK